MGAVQVPRASSLHSGEIIPIRITRLTRKTGEVTCDFVPTWQPRLVLVRLKCAA